MGRSVSFGPFEFDPHTGELRKYGIRIKIQGQPVELLAILIEQPGELVTREDLEKRLWPADTHVDFEHSLNAAMKRLRVALGDSAQAPRFVETIARRGYRFIAPVGQAGEAVQPVGNVPQAVVLDPQPVRQRRFPVVAAATTAFVLALLVGGAILGSRRDALRRRTEPGPIRSLAVLPLANLSGDRDQDYFVDGLTDLLRQNLQGISSLRVVSRTSSMHYRGTGRPLPDIARELNRSSDPSGLEVICFEAEDLLAASSL